MSAKKVDAVAKKKAYLVEKGWLLFDDGWQPKLAVFARWPGRYQDAFLGRYQTMDTNQACQWQRMIDKPSQSDVVLDAMHWFCQWAWEDMQAKVAYTKQMEDEGEVDRGCWDREVLMLKTLEEFFRERGRPLK